MNGTEQSDSPIVPRKLANKAARAAAEPMEGSGGTKRNAELQSTVRTQSRATVSPKADGRQRPLGIAAIEDKIVQAAVVAILTPIYEAEFLGFSYGFRPGRCQHDALDALAYGIRARKINWILDADIRSFFDTISPEWLVRFIEHRIGDRRL